MVLSTEHRPNDTTPSTTLSVRPKSAARSDKFWGAQLRQAQEKGAKSSYTTIQSNREENDTMIRTLLTDRYSSESCESIEEYARARASFTRDAATDTGGEDRFTMCFIHRLVDDREYKTSVYTHIKKAAQDTSAWVASRKTPGFDLSTSPPTTGSTKEQLAWWKRRNAAASQCLTPQVDTRSWAEVLARRKPSKSHTRPASTQISQVAVSQAADCESSADPQDDVDSTSDAAALTAFTPSQTSNASSHDVRPLSDSHGSSSACKMSLGTALLATTLATGAAYTAYQWWKD